MTTGTFNGLNYFGYVIYVLQTSTYQNIAPTNVCPGYDTKQADGEAPIMLELWGMRSTPSLLLLPGPLWPGMVAPDRALSMGWIEVTA